MEQEYKPSLKARLFKGLISIFMYPRRMVKRYNGYNASIGEMIHEAKVEGLHALRARNAIVVNIFIFMPWVVGISITLANLYLHRDYYEIYYTVITAPYEAGNIFSLIGQTYGKIKFALFKFPLNFKDFSYYFYGHLGAIVGAFILSKNKFFKMEEKIKEVLVHNNHLDRDGYPWKVTWTPKAILFDTFNCDPYKFYLETKFWNSINFAPTQPKKFKNNMNKFVVQSKYELPQELIFTASGIPADIYEKIKNHKRVD